MVPMKKPYIMNYISGSSASNTFTQSILVKYMKIQIKTKEHAMRIGEIIREGERELPVWEPNKKPVVTPQPEKMPKPEKVPERIN
jgi:hypothetical protein